MPIRIVVALAVAAIVAAESAAADPSASTNVKFASRAGCTWVVEPFRWEEDVQMEGANGVVVLVQQGSEKELVTLFAMSHDGVEGIYSCRPIAFDEHGKRHDLRPHVARASDPDGKGAMLYRWRSDPEVLPASQVRYVGLEGLTIEGRRREVQTAARNARKSAEAKGLEVLSFPVVGQPYTFELTDVDGRVIESRELIGKIVVLDYWATWCGPCIQKMPKLKKLYDQWHQEGLEIVGINFDTDREVCISAVEKLSLPWKHAMAPTHGEAREIWMKANGIQSLPRLLVVDRNGVLRSDCGPDELEEQLSILLEVSRKD